MMHQRSFCLSLALILSSVPCGASGLAHQLRQLAKAEGFRIRGLATIGNAPSQPAGGPQIQRLRSLLEDFDYVIVHAPGGRVQRLIILGPKRPPPSMPPPLNEENGRGILIRTRRDGQQHLVDAVLVGTEGQRLPLELLIDIGAELTLLPLSKAHALGLVPEQLPFRTVHTTSGTLRARVGKIGALELGKARIRELKIGFAEDTALGAHALLGMNLLSRYLFILDDEHNELTLLPDPH